MAETRVHSFLNFEKPIAELEGKIEELRHLSDDGEISIVEEIERLQARVDRQLGQTYAKLTPWQKVQVSRHGERPHALDYIESIFTDIVFLHGDKKYADDNAIVGGLAKISDNSVFFIGTEKGNTMETRIKHNFGMAKPEGYRKVQRLIKLAEKFKLPLISFVDTAGAFPGKDAEERGQSESIASSIKI